MKSKKYKILPIKVCLVIIITKWSLESLGKGTIIDRHKGGNKDSQDRKKRGKN